MKQEIINDLLGKGKVLSGILIFALLFRIILSFLVWHPDVNNHLDWGIRFFEYGPEKFYAPETNVWSYTWPNQPPGTIYIFALSRKVFEWIFNFFWVINVKVPPFPSGVITYFEHNLYPAAVKLPGVLADFGIAYIIYKFLEILDNKKRVKYLPKIGALLYLYNPFVWYVSSVWGQYDSVISFFAIFSFYLLYKKRLTLSLTAIAMCLYIKLSLIIFLPIYLVYIIKQKYKLFDLIKSVIIPIVIIGALTLPFSVSEPYTWLYKLYIDKVYVQQQHLITANAFNIWATIASIHLRPYTIYLGPLMYKTWGFIFFAISFIPVIYYTYRKSDTNTLLWSLAISSYASFMLLTNMHERYIYPLFPILTILTLRYPKIFWIYILISVISVLNLYNFWWIPRMEFLINFLAYRNRLLPRILGLINFIVFIYFYYQYLRQMGRAKL